ncbi:MAG: 4Fe-4S dicluster domain-containing protein [Candidatus Bathyarchaeia archaeon]
MPLKKIKQETAEALTLQWVLHVKNYKLALDKNICVGCQICGLACPKEAIKVEKQLKNVWEKAKKPKVDVDLAKCNFCGICDVLCPYGAIKVTLNGQHTLAVIEKESFPQPVRDIQVNPSKFPADFVGYKDVCPLNLIKITQLQAEGAKETGTVIEIEKEKCPCCRVCEFKFPEGAIRVRKFMQGKIVIKPEKCPEGCTDCLDVCPIKGALYLSDKDKKVHVDETFCVYCGACKIVCPVNDALEVKRTWINHTAVRSGAWNKAMERLTSPLEISKELKTKGSRKARESVSRRLKY